MLITNVTILLLSGQLAGLFSLTPETAAIVRQLILFHNLMAIVFWPPAFALPNALRAAGDAKFTMVASLVAMWACRIGLSFLLGKTFGLGVLGVWIAMTLDWVVRAALFIWRYRGSRWEQQRVI